VNPYSDAKPVDHDAKPGGAVVWEILAPMKPYDIEVQRGKSSDGSRK
jgi:hypothetical protein